MSRRYVLLDVFSDQPLQGNQLAVVLDGEGLGDAAMQAIAAEFNLAETVFVLPPEKPAHRARLRIFATTRELPFAGHPTVGTAVALALEDQGPDASGLDAMLMLEENVGSIRCGVSLKSGRLGHAIFDLPILPAPLELPFDRPAIGAALGLEPSEIDLENHLPSAFSAGVPYRFVPVRNLDAIGRIQPRADLWEKAFPNRISVYAYTRETAAIGHQFHARMFWPGLGLIEDPATGSAAAAFAGVVSTFDQLPSGSHRFIIEQGYEMGRPSRIALEVDIEQGALHAGRIGGDAVVIGRGTIDL